MLIHLSTPRIFPSFEKQKEIIIVITIINFSEEYEGLQIAIFFSIENSSSNADFFSIEDTRILLHMFKKKAIQFFLSSPFFFYFENSFFVSMSLHKYINIRTRTQVKEVFSRRGGGGRRMELLTVAWSGSRGLPVGGGWKRGLRERKAGGVAHASLTVNSSSPVGEQRAGWSGRTVGCTHRRLSRLVLCSSRNQ